MDEQQLHERAATQLEVTAAGEYRGDFVFLRAGSLRLLMTQNEAATAVHLDSLPEPTDFFGFFSVPGDVEGRCFVAISEKMELLDRCPKERYMATPLPVEGGILYWCWDEVRVILDREIAVSSLPTAIVTPRSPLRLFTEMDKMPVYICGGEQLNSVIFG